MIRVLLTTTSFQDAPIVVDWATSVMAMGRVQQLAREGKPLPPEAAADKDGKPTLVAKDAAALLPSGRSRTGKIKAVLDDVLGGGNSGCLLPGQLEAQADRPRSTSNP